jgi:hypothetical protein
MADAADEVDERAAAEPKEKKHNDGAADLERVTDFAEEKELDEKHFVQVCARERVQQASEHCLLTEGNRAGSQVPGGQAACQRGGEEEAVCRREAGRRGTVDLMLLYGAGIRDAELAAVAIKSADVKLVVRAHHARLPR